jgi:hypothetical protein
MLVVIDGIVVEVSDDTPLATITANNGAGDTTPLLILGYEASRTSRNIVHDLIEGMAVTLVSPRPRSGTLGLLYTDETEAFAALELHAERTSFTLESLERSVTNMTYVIDGSVSIALDTATRDHWVVSIQYQEIDA